MNAINRLLRSTAFRLSLIYLAVFAAFAVFLIAYLVWHTRLVLDDQLAGTLQAEVRGLAEQYRIGGIRRLAVTVETRSRSPSSTLYLVTTPAGETIAGNVAAAPPGVLEAEGPVRVAYQRYMEDGLAKHQALVVSYVLPGGFRLLVGRDLEELIRFQDLVTRTAVLALALMLVLGVGGGTYVSRRILSRLDAMAAASRTIMAGDMTGRVPLAGSGDEFDRLATSLNQMLDRIDRLMRGLKDVADDIAHDLRSPLTRLKGRVEAALRGAPDAARYREALEATIEEADQLISVFNALLTIARAEAGRGGVAMAPFDLSTAVRDVAELYEAVAEERGVALDIAASGALTLIGNRELVGQAVANLLDNALTHAVGDGGAPRVDVVVHAREGRALIEVADNGPGIAPEDRARVFDRFVRLERSRTKPGSGLGLSLVAAIGELHGGTVTLEDNGPGLKAVLALPLGGCDRTGREAP